MKNANFLTGKALKSAIRGFSRRVKSWTEHVAILGSSCVKHAAEHGDTVYLNQFFEVLPSAYTKPFITWLVENGVHEWMRVEKGVFYIKEGDEAKKARKKFNEEFNSPVDWTDFKVSRQTEFDLDAVKRRLESLKKSIEKHPEVEVPEAVIVSIDAALEALAA